MERPNMSSYHPFAVMGKSCETRQIRGKRVVWPGVTRKESADGLFVMRAPERNDIDRLVELWRASYGEVYGSVHEWILMPEEYEARVAFLETWEGDRAEKECLMIVFEDLGTGTLFAAAALTRFDRNLQIELSFFAIHPDYRQGNGGLYIWSEIPALYEWLKDSGAEYLTVFCETWHNITQYLWFKRMGWKVAGIFPGAFTRWTGDDREYRGCVVYLYKMINDGERYSTKPEEWRILPEVKRLWDAMEEINSLSDEELMKKP